MRTRWDVIFPLAPTPNICMGHRGGGAFAESSKLRLAPERKSHLRNIALSAHLVIIDPMLPSGATVSAASGAMRSRRWPCRSYLVPLRAGNAAEPSRLDLRVPFGDNFNLKTAVEILRMGGETRILEGMARDTSSLSAHQLGEQPLVVESDPSAGVNLDSFWGPVHVE